MSPQILKQQFKNNTQGWVGAVSLGPKGDEQGVAVEPDGTVWLSEAEQILTANAPRRPEDNPFIPQTHVVVDPTSGERVEVQVTPLTPIDEGRYVPANERPIAGDLQGAAQAAATGDEPTTPISADVLQNPITREDQIIANGPQTRPGDVPAPARAAAAAAAAQAAQDAEAEAEVPESAPEPPSAPESAPAPEPQPPSFPTPAAPVPPAADPARAVPEDEGRVPQVPEETAAQSPGPASEETGAAVPPTGVAPQGEYQAGEEVGTPDAPATTDESAAASDAPAADETGQPPAPFIPDAEG